MRMSKRENKNEVDEEEKGIVRRRGEEEETEVKGEATSESEKGKTMSGGRL